MVAVIPLHTVFRGKIGHGTLIPGTIERWKGTLGFSRGVTGAAGAAATWGALFTAQTRCSRRRETGSIFVFSNSFYIDSGQVLRKQIFGPLIRGRP